ncbi:hypothetical protein CDL15_Pgr006517 [Punica granatum]|uniref:Uncharacterized protein n=1 Tax=Punica granatum TaxID=22663 RepID=A0A218XZX7_PUNGR|nr:hypothetical protein CDL15_Pgr006517 [Punica granatum]
MILDQPSNTAQLSSVDSLSSTVGKSSMLSKQFDTAYTTSEGQSRPPAKHNHLGGNASHAYHYTIPTKPRPYAKRPSSAPRAIP